MLANVKKFTALFVILSILFAGVFCLIGMGSMPMNSNVHCGSQNLMSLCSMTPVDHMTMFQSVVRFQPQKLFATSVLLAGYLLFAYINSLSFLEGLILRRILTSLKDSIEGPDYLMLAFSRGILNPKLF
jgi:hypothetical protein